MTAGDLFFSTQGRIGRSAYWVGMIAIAAISYLSSITLWGALGPSLYSGAAGRFALIALTILWLYPSYCVMAKRFQDQNESAAFALIGPGVTVLVAALVLFPVELHDPWHPQALVRLLLYVQAMIALFYFIALGCVRGTAGPNRYGPNPNALYRRPRTLPGAAAGVGLTARRPMPVRIVRPGQLQTSF